MMVPTIHLNGTSKEQLLTAIVEAHSALLQAEGKLAETAPNGRDFYTQGAVAHTKAMDEHVSRYQRLETVRKELEQLAEEIDTQGRKTTHHHGN